jgi:transcriptional regulator with XRE-family HTH domain
MAEIANNQKKDWAYLLFTKEDYTQKEIASKVCISEQTLSKWVNEEKWKEVRLKISQSKHKQLMSLYQHLDNVNKELNTEGRIPTSKELDAISKLTSSIKRMETKAGIAEIVDVFKEYFDWLRLIDFSESKRQIETADAFIKSRLTK